MSENIPVLLTRHRVLRSLVEAVWTSGSTLRHRVMRGTAWLLGADLANRGLGLIKVTVLARLLAPDDFGLMGIALLIFSWFEMFSQTGFSTALIRKSGDVDSYLGTYWTVQTIRGALLSSAMFAGAPLVGWLFRNPEVIPIVKAVSIVSLMRGAANPAIIYLRRELRIEREVIWRVGGNVTGLIVAIPLAFYCRNVWALVFAALAANVAELALSYCVVNYRPHFELDWAKTRELMQYGRWIFYTNILTYLSQYSDGWVVGRFLGSISLGYYQIAQQFGMAPLAAVGGPINSMTLPAFSKLQDDPALRAAFLRAIRFIAMALLPVGVLGTVLAGTGIRIVLGERWMPARPLLQLLIWSGIATTLSGVTNSLLQAVNQPEHSARAAVLRFAAFAALFYPLMRWHGMVGVATAAAVSAPLSVGYLYWRAGKALGWGWDLLSVFRPALAACLPGLAAGGMVPFVSSTWSAAGIGILAGAGSAAIAVDFTISQGHHKTIQKYKAA